MPVIVRSCQQCGNPLSAKQTRFCSVACSAAFRRGPNHPTFKGRVAHTAGYIRVWEPSHPLASGDGYVLEHRKVLHDAGIDVPAGSHVHHLNGDKADNCLSNLEVLSVTEHMAEHRQLGMPVINQFGTFEVLTREEYTRRQREFNKRPKTPAQRQRIRERRHALRLERGQPMRPSRWKTAS